MINVDNQCRSCKLSMREWHQTKIDRLKRAGDRLCHHLNILSSTHPLGSSNNAYIAKLTQEWEKTKEELK